MGKRVVALFFIFALAVGTLSMRMLTLSVSDAAVTAQAGNTLSTVVGETRGYIYDRNMQPLVNAERELAVAVKPTVQALNCAGAVLSNAENKNAVFETVENGKIAVAAADAPLTEADAKTVSRVARYSADGLAVHLIGYINADGDGVCGLEQYYNEALQGARGVLRARCGVDAKGRLLDGAELQFTSENYDSPAGVQVTLDKAIQIIAEEALQKFEIGTGAVVVLDTATSEILALASVPEFSQIHPEKSLDAVGAPFVNRAITPYSVGSVFKAVVAAAAIENGTDESFSYTCTGAYTIGETVFNCHVHEGHGKQNLFAATANSCNPYFIDLALHTGRESVCAMSENLGLGAKIELADGFYAKAGISPAAYSLTSPQDLANFAFGQGELLASPLQMTAVYAAIANGGIYRAPSLMRAVIDASGEEVQRAFLPTSRRAMSEETAKRVGALLQYTVENGSGRRAKPSNGTAAGKTATAQSGWFDENGAEVTQSWFCGYFPYESPRYAVTVLKENGEGGSADCAPVFRYIAEEILKLG